MDINELWKSFLNTFFPKRFKNSRETEKKNLHTLFVQLLIERMDLYVDTSGKQKLNLLLSCQIPLKSKGLGHILLD